MAVPIFDPLFTAHSLKEEQELALPVSATDPDGPDPIITVSTGADWPASAITFSQGVLNWTPPAGASNAGPYDATLRATDSTDPLNFSEVVISISVTNKQTCLIQGGGKLVIGNGTRLLANAEVGDSFTYTGYAGRFVILSIPSDTQLEVDVNFSALDRNVEFQIGHVFTGKFNLPIPSRRDANKAALVSDTIEKIDAALAVMYSKYTESFFSYGDGTIITFGDGTKVGLGEAVEGWGYGSGEAVSFGSGEEVVL